MYRINLVAFFIGLYGMIMSAYAGNKVYLVANLVLAIMNLLLYQYGKKRAALMEQQYKALFEKIKKDLNKDE